ncbi:hypothetical protein KAU11_11110, partial [Candidatus Babeliales bacterium]|nr:hypothetical protein [Candidatus Babeliales bacterium]
MVKLVVMHYLSNYQWFRERVGGRWEQYWNGACHCDMWFNNEPKGRRPPMCFGNPLVEDYRVP